MIKQQWGDWPNFSFDEMACKETGENEMDPSFMDSLQWLRNECGFPLTGSSGYRSPSHPIESRKNSPGAHTHGKAVDIQISGDKAFKLLSFAFDPHSGFFGIGISQSGVHNNRFVHLDSIINIEGFPRPIVWSY